jgi:hypothetical protein
MPKRHRKKNPQRKKAPTKQVAQARADAEPDDYIDPSELVRLIGMEIERKKLWVQQFREQLEIKGMTDVALTHDQSVAVVELEFLTPENSPMPSSKDVEAMLHRVATDCGREFAPRQMVILTDQRRCKAKFELARQS